MMDSMNFLFQQNFFTTQGELESIVLRLVLAFVLGQFLAWVYAWTHRGLSYSRSFVQSLVILSMIVTLVMIVIANNIVTAFGLLGALALIRFRNVLKDTRDTAFIFAALVLGIGVGVERYGASIIGAVAFAAITVYLHWTAFGSRQRHDGFLRFRLAPVDGAMPNPSAVLQRHCSATTLVSVRRTGPADPADYTYQISLRDRSRNEEFLQELNSFTGVSELSLALQEEMQEV